LELQAKLGSDWTHIWKAERVTDETLQRLGSVLVPDQNRPLVEDATVIFFGSIARGECTSNSDTDWVVLVDGQVDEQHFQAYRRTRKALIEASFIQPGSSGTFGNLAFSHDIVHRIGGQDDTNRNLTFRMLLLLESVSIGERIVRDRVIRAILRRYLADDPSWTFRSDGKIPRFLLNDSVRFWRTMAVDFADKFHDQAGEKWALRNVKLRFSRKLIFLFSMLACFSWQLHRSEISSDRTSDSVESALSYLFGYFDRAPLEVIADELLREGVSTETCDKILSSYNEFLGVLDDDAKREELEKLPRDLAEKSELFQNLRTLSHTFRDGLREWLFDTNGRFFELVRDYGLF
jgi:predicted nucleotidyltransferase